MLVYYLVPFIVSNHYLLFWVSNGHNSVTVQIRTHVYINFFHHKDLGNHLLQLCPKVVKHPVFYCFNFDVLWVESLWHIPYKWFWPNIVHLWQECHNSKFVIFQGNLLKVLKCYNFLWVQRWHKLLSSSEFYKPSYDTIPVKSASANVSFYTNNSKMPNFELWHSCRKWAIYKL